MEFTDTITYDKDKDTVITYSWIDAVNATKLKGLDDKATAKIMAICTDGLPKSQTGDGFTLTIKKDHTTKDVTITCKAACDGGTKVTPSDTTKSTQSN